MSIVVISVVAMLCVTTMALTVFVTKNSTDGDDKSKAKK
jgi:hypothetical protein|nr:MAG TPA: hypothetical protein [Caudoviricetes sp.]